MNHTTYVISALALSFLALTPARAQSPSLRAAADSFVAISTPATAAWPDRSDSTRERQARRLDALAAALRRIDARRLTEPADRLLYANLVESVDASIGTRICRNYLWAFSNQFAGWHVIASNAARVQPVGSDGARETALTVFRQLREAIRVERRLLQRGLDSGYSISQPVVDAVLRQLDDLLPIDVARSPLVAPATRDGSAEFVAAWRALLTDSIYPAAHEHRAFLANVYRPKARSEGSLSGLPRGAQCYAATTRVQTSLRADVDSVMRDARVQLDSIRSVLAPLARRLTSNQDLSAAIVELRTSPRFTFPSRDSVFQAYREMTVLAARRFERVVTGLAAESLAVSPYPDFQERANLPPQYLRASDDGSRPAQMLINLSRMERMAVANAIAHEAYPGHHLQRIAAVRAPTVHPAMRFVFVSGFAEGWGIYSEDLAGEMGLYVAPLDTAGMLVHLLDVAVANYLDIAYHTRGWTRAQLVDSMVALGGRTRDQAGAYADRHAATPGQLASYYYGYRAIRAARGRAQRALAADFDLRRFNYEVLRDGSITLASLEEKIDRWIRADKKRP